MKAKKVIALVMCATMVAGMSATCVMAADDMPEQFKDLKAAEAYEFPMMVKSFQSTYWDAAQEGMKKACLLYTSYPELNILCSFNSGVKCSAGSDCCFSEIYQFLHL